jgi:hypothetical protein
MRKYLSEDSFSVIEMAFFIWSATLYTATDSAWSMIGVLLGVAISAAVKPK